MQKVRKTLLGVALATLLIPSDIVYAANPYGGGWSNCTWGAWELARSSTGIELPAWGNAGDWLWSAANSGYATGSTPAANSIAVWSGHVAYVAGYDGSDSIYIQEGGYQGSYSEGYAPAYGGRHGQTLLGYIYLGSGPIEPISYEPEITEIQEIVTSQAIVSEEGKLIEEINSIDEASYIQVIPGISVAVGQETVGQLEENAAVVVENNVTETIKQEDQQAMEDVIIELQPTGQLSFGAVSLVKHN